MMMSKSYGPGRRSAKKHKAGDRVPLDDRPSRLLSYTEDGTLRVYLHTRSITERQAAEIMGISRDQVRAALGKKGDSRARPISKALLQKLIEATTPKEDIAQMIFDWC